MEVGQLSQGVVFNTFEIRTSNAQPAHCNNYRFLEKASCSSNNHAIKQAANATTICNAVTRSRRCCALLMKCPTCEVIMEDDIMGYVLDTRCQRSGGWRSQLQRLAVVEWLFLLRNVTTEGKKSMCMTWHNTLCTKPTGGHHVVFTCSICTKHILPNA